LIQEHIGQPDQEYTTGIFSDGKNISSITFKRKLGLGSLSVEVELADSLAMDQMAENIARQTNLIGSINIQTRLCNGAFIPFEINPRFSSTVGFRKQFGFMDCFWWPKVALGEAYTYQKQYKSGRGVRSLTESYVEMERI
jgi:carbamoyl-phosphate synthase large subunit